MEGEVQLDGWIGYEREAGILHERLSWLVHGLEWAVTMIDLLAILVFLVGAARFVWGYVQAELWRNGPERVRKLNRERVELGRYILTGLEVLIVSDVIHTALSLKMIDLVFLAILVVIRSVTSFFLDREMEQIEKELGS
jgi:uncharacterized membrane protein